MSKKSLFALFFYITDFANFQKSEAKMTTNENQIRLESAFKALEHPENLRRIKYKRDLERYMNYSQKRISLFY